LGHFESASTPFSAFLVISLDKSLLFTQYEIYKTSEVFHLNNFYTHIMDLNKSIGHISAMVVSGPDSGSKALWTSSGYIYKTSDSPLFNKLSASLADIMHTALITIDDQQILCEPLGSRPSLIICGAGHISMPLIQIGRMLEFYVTVIDDRPQFANNARNLNADHVICNSFAKGLREIPETSNNYFVIVTRGHRYDVDCLEEVIDRANSYIGMIGSRKRIANVKEVLLDKGILREALDHIHMPIGLDIKAETPEEIAIAIMAEIIQVKNTTYATYHYSKELLSALAAPSSESMKKALAVIIRRHGSAPRNIGTKMLVFEDGSAIGTLGGGCAEAEVLEKARDCIRHHKASTIHIDMTGRQVEDEGMVCGGIIDVFIEPLS